MSGIGCNASIFPSWGVVLVSMVCKFSAPSDSDVAVVNVDKVVSPVSEECEHLQAGVVFKSNGAKIMLSVVIGTSLSGRSHVPCP